MNIEVEKRGLLSEQEYISLFATVRDMSPTDAEENNTESVFYLTESAQVKIQRATSKRTAKIAWKSGGNDGADHREEIELKIQPDEFPQAQRLIEKLSPNAQKFITKQQRHDFIIDGINVSLKHSTDWGYHVELDKTATDKNEVQSALKTIEALAEKLGIRLLSAQEEKDFVNSTIAKAKR